MQHKLMIDNTLLFSFKQDFEDFDQNLSSFPQGRL